LRDIVEKSIKSHLVLIDDKRIQCDFLSKIDHPIIKGNADYLEIMVDNLLVNAIHYTPKGGKISLVIDNDETNVTLTISDNGVGIPKHERDNVFKRFYRILGSDIIGSGLGLSIVKDIVDAHDAILSIDDGLNGQGTSFKIIFKI